MKGRSINRRTFVGAMCALGGLSVAGASLGNRVKIDRATGRILGVGGNPYNPADAYPFLDHDAPLTEAFQSMSFANGKGNLLRGTVCGRGNATLNGYSQPDRITTPLKRAGKRGEGKWKPIGWDGLIKEGTEGGKVFAGTFGTVNAYGHASS